jgi:hypothetical protein
VGVTIAQITETTERWFLLCLGDIMHYMVIKFKKYLLTALLFLPLYSFGMTTNQSSVVLSLSTGDEIGFVQISNQESFEIFKEFIFNPEKSTIRWDICYLQKTCSPGQKKVFVRYLDHQKNILGVAEKTINYQKQITKSVVPLSPPVDTPTELSPEPPIVSVSDEPVIGEDVTKIPGCTQISAQNYDPSATIDNGSCVSVSRNYHIPILSVGLIAGIVQTIFAIGSFGVSLVEVPLFISRMVSQFFIFIGARKKPKHWGTIIDHDSGAGLDPVVVSLFSHEKKIASVITDMEGRFGFLVPAGIYRLVPEKTHYQFPVMNTSQYQGEDFSIGENDIVDLDIPMERMTADWNEQEKNNIIPIWKRKRKIIDRFFLVIFLGVAFYSGLQFLQIPNILNGFFFGMNIGIIEKYCEFNSLLNHHFH